MCIVNQGAVGGNTDAFIEPPSVIGNTILAQPILVAFSPIACPKLASLSQVAAFATCSRKIPGRNTEALKVLSLIIGNTIFAQPLVVTFPQLAFLEISIFLYLVAFTACCRHIQSQHTQDRVEPVVLFK